MRAHEAKPASRMACKVIEKEGHRGMVRPETERRQTEPSRPCGLRRSRQKNGTESDEMPIPRRVPRTHALSVPFLALQGPNLVLRRLLLAHRAWRPRSACRRIGPSVGCSKCKRFRSSMRQQISLQLVDARVRMSNRLSHPTVGFSSSRTWRISMRTCPGSRFWVLSSTIRRSPAKATSANLASSSLGLVKGVVSAPTTTVWRPTWSPPSHP